MKLQGRRGAGPKTSVLCPFNIIVISEKRFIDRKHNDFHNRLNIHYGVVSGYNSMKYDHVKYDISYSHVDKDEEALPCKT